MYLYGVLTSLVFSVRNIFNGVDWSLSPIYFHTSMTFLPQQQKLSRSVVILNYIYIYILMSKLIYLFGLTMLISISKWLIYIIFVFSLDVLKKVLIHVIEPVKYCMMSELFLNMCLKYCRMDLVQDCLV